VKGEHGVVVAAVTGDLGAEPGGALESVNLRAQLNLGHD
jgi:hypothetical protein